MHSTSKSKAALAVRAREARPALVCETASAHLTSEARQVQPRSVLEAELVQVCFAAAILWRVVACERCHARAALEVEQAVGTWGIGEQESRCVLTVVCVCL